MRFKDYNELYEYLNSLELEDDIIIMFSRILDGRICSLQEEFIRYDNCIKKFRKIMDVYGDYDDIYLYGYTKLSEVIIVHQTIECEVSI